MQILKKRIKIIACALVLSSIVSGCGINTVDSDSKEEIKIGVCVHDEYETFLHDMVEYMREWARNKEKDTGIRFTIDVVSAKGNQLTQNDQVANFIDKGYDVLCVNIVDRTDTSAIIDNAISSKTPVIFFNRELVQEDLDRWDKLYYVGAVAEQSGRLQAQIIKEALEDKETFDKIDANHNGTIQYVILEGDKKHQDTIVRTQVVQHELGRDFSLEKLGDEYTDWSIDQGKSKMNSLIDKYPFQIELVIANNDDIALGAIKALEENNYPLDVFIVGVDGTKEGLEAIRTRKLDGSVYNDGKSQSEAIMKMAYSLATNGDIPEDVQLTFGKYAYLPYSIITYDNVRDYQK